MFSQLPNIYLFLGHQGVLDNVEGEFFSSILPHRKEHMVSCPCGADVSSREHNFYQDVTGRITVLELSVLFDIRFLHFFLDVLSSISWMVSFTWILVDSLADRYDIFLCKVRCSIAPFLAIYSACSFPSIWQCSGIHCKIIVLPLTFTAFMVSAVLVFF